MLFSEKFVVVLNFHDASMFVVGDSYGITSLVTNFEVAISSFAVEAPVFPIKVGLQMTDTWLRGCVVITWLTG